MSEDYIQKHVKKAIDFFWNKRNMQGRHSADKSGRGAVTGGKQLDGFVNMFVELAKANGVPADCIYTETGKITLPGFFRASKNWDMLIIAPNGKLIAALELKSQIGSYGNNFNNRAEEAIGNAVDLWTAFREHAFPPQPSPWVGYMMVAGKDKASTRKVTERSIHYPVLPDFVQTSYIDRYGILCRKLVSERHYSSVGLVWTSEDKSYGDVYDDVSITTFINSFVGHLYGQRQEFK